MMVEPTVEYSSTGSVVSLVSYASFFKVQPGSNGAVPQL